MNMSFRDPLNYEAMIRQKISSAHRDFVISLEGSGRAPSTIESYSRKIRLFMCLVGDIYLHEISDNTLSLALIRFKEGFPQTVPRAGTSMNQIRSALKTFFSWAVSSGRISRNPAINLRLAKAVHRPITAITGKELTQLFETINKNDSFLARRDAALFSFYAFIGVRRSEALSLRIDDLDFQKNRIWLSKSKTSGGEFKSMPDKLKTILVNYLMQRPNRDAFLRSPYLFPGRDIFRPLSPREAHLRFEYWKKASNLRQKLTLHSFRSGFATRLYDATKDPVLVSSAMGHKNLTSIHRYISMKEDSIRSAMEKAFCDIAPNMW